MSKDLKIVAVGEDTVGKTALLTVLNEKPFPDRYVPTNFEEFVKDATIQNIPYNLHLWDTGGHTEYDCHRPLSYAQANAVLLCFALDNKPSLTALADRWIPEVKHYARDAKLVLIGTKADLRQNGGANQVSDDDAKQFVSAQHCDGYIACSPKSGDGMNLIFPAAAKAGDQKKKGGCLLL
jgi:small GTP-binding protein